MPSNDADERFVHKKELLERTGRSYAFLCEQMKLGKFPKPREDSGRPAWLNSDLNAWMRGSPPRPVRGDPGAAQLYAKQHAIARKSAESKRRTAAKTRRENVRVRSGKRREAE
jgi:predicted DNA-binding transcriptional regulator AlpA